jgi:3'-phosphoadenosine 5'-phosphosulfate sulfotransferase (PAPS reductase)/FAD synthetase
MESDNKKQSERHILNLSGGKDSTALAVFMRKIHPELPLEYVFCDTGKELAETYAYLNRIEAGLGIKITRLNSEASFDHWWKVFGGYLPSPQMRWCTKLLKLKPFEAHVGDDPVSAMLDCGPTKNGLAISARRKTFARFFRSKSMGSTTPA